MFGLFPGDKNEKSPSQTVEGWLKVKKEVDLMRGGFWPFFEFIKDIECGQHSISVWGNLKGGNTKVVGHPLVERM